MTSSRAAEWVDWPEDVASRYRAFGLWTGQTLWAMLEAQAQTWGGKRALIDQRRAVTYAELCARSLSLSNGLSSLGIRGGDAVVVQLPNCIEQFELYFALFRLGARPIMALPAHRERELGHFVEQTGAVAHVTTDVRGGCDYRQLSARVRARHDCLHHSLIVGDAGDLIALESLYEQTNVPRETPSVRAEQVALFQLSGGSTNISKLIPRTHDDYLYSVRQSVAVCGFDQETVYLAALPAAHNFPLSSPGVLGILYAGATAVLAESAAPDHAFPWIARERVTHTALVPALLSPWLERARTARSDLASLRLLQIGGAKLPETLARRVAPELGCRLQQVFGMAEGLVCYTRLDDPPERVIEGRVRPMSVWDELRVVDERGCELGHGEIGDLLVRGPYTIRGYYRAEEYNRSAFDEQGYYRTGDRVRTFPDGSLVVEGRSKEQINRAGEKIAAPEVEELLCSHPAVRHAAVVAMPDPYLGERSCAFVVLCEPATAELLRAHLRAAGLAPYKLPDRVEVLENLPLTAVGKVDKTTLSERARIHAAPRRNLYREPIS